MVFAAECLRLTFTCCSPNDCSEIHLHVFILQRLQAGGRKLPRHTKKQQRYGRHRAQQQFLPFHTKHVTEVLFCDIPLRDFTRYQHPDGTEGGGGGATRPYTFIPLTPIRSTSSTSITLCPHLPPSKQANKTTSSRCRFSKKMYLTALELIQQEGPGAHQKYLYLHFSYSGDEPT